MENTLNSNDSLKKACEGKSKKQGGLNVADLKKLVDTKDKNKKRDELLKILCKDIEETPEFPFKRLNYTDKQIKGKFDNLSKYEFKFNNMKFIPSNLFYLNHYMFLYEGKEPRLIIHEKSDYENYNILSDMFMEESRMKCHVINRESPWDYYFKHHKELKKESQEKFKSTEPKVVREVLFSRTKECTSFRPTLLVGMIKLFNVKSVLDFSAGWGDRLIAAMCMKVRYTGVDPNKNNFKFYEDMITFFKRSKKKYNMIQSPFEDTNIKDKYDLVFTSPPYYSLEKYSDDKSQSINKFSSEESWTNNFLLVALSKAWKSVNTNGHMVIIINQKDKRETYVKKMFDHMYNNFKDCQYVGCIGYTNKIENRRPVNPQPMFIWRKTVDIIREIYNPDIYVLQYNATPKIKVNVIRDDILYGGTKLRGVVNYFSGSKYDEFVYVSPSTGLAQVALAQAAYLTNKKVTIFMQKPRNNYLSKQTLNSRSFREHVNFIFRDVRKMGELWGMAENYVQRNKNAYLFDLGFNEEKYNKILEDNIRQAIPKDLKPKRLWCASGSATLLQIFYKVFPETHFCVVQVGKQLKQERLNERTTVYVSDEFFYNKANIQPPYPTVTTYDAKLWKYVLQYGKNGDYVWNVGKE